MAQSRRRHARRDALVFLGSLLAHALVFFFAARELTIPFRLPRAQEPAFQVEIQPPETPIIPPPPEVVPRPQPTPKPQAQPQPAPPVTAPPAPTPQPPAATTAPAKAAVNPAPAPAPRAAELPTPLAPPAAAPQPGPPQETPQAPKVAIQPKVITAPTLRLHRSNQENASPLAPPVSIPGAVFAQPGPPQGAGPQGAGPKGAGAVAGGAGLPGGVLPGFGGGLRGSLLGCIDQSAAKLSAEEKARCAERLGEGVKVAPAMDPIGASRRQVLNDQAARQSAADKYRDETPPLTNGDPAATIPLQPRLGHKPGGN
ncbi:MAG: hypothetical protein JO127_04145 [Caulobacteraceae bacterium]|nr:hypothetical protein [Caulobacteraceae bacterium]